MDSRCIDYGKIRYEYNELNALWINSHIKSFQLFCHFIEPNDYLYNGIEVKSEQSSNPLNKELLNILFRTQIQKKYEQLVFFPSDKKYGDNEEYSPAPSSKKVLRSFID